jgi:hypothetical protein
MKELHAGEVRITDAFWAPRVRVNAERAIYHQW